MPKPGELLRSRWLILVIVWLPMLTVFLLRLCVGPLAPFLKDNLGISNVQVGSLAGSVGITYIPTVIVAGWLADRFGVHRILVAGTLINGLFATAVFFASSYRDVFILLMLSGLGSGCVFPPTVKAIMLWFPLRERATAMGFNQTAINVAGIASAGLFPTVAITLGWRYSFLFMGLGTFVVCLSTLLFYRDPPGENPVKVLRSISNPRASKPATSRLRLNLFQSRDIWMLLLAGFFLNVVEFGMMNYLLLYLKESLLFGVVAAGGLLAMTQVAGALGKPASGLVSDRMLGGHRRVMFILMGSIGSLICLLLSLAGNNLGWLLYPVLFIMGVTAIGWGGLFTALAGELAGKELSGTAAGVSTVALVLGTMVGPPLFGYAVDNGSFQVAWMVMALAGIIGAVCVFLIREHKRRT